MKRSALLAMVLLATRTGLASNTADKAAAIEELLARYQKCGYFNGAVLVAEHGKVIYAKGVGEADMQAHTPNTPQTKFDVASITKQFTAALVLQQVAEGKIRLEGTVSEYLPWYRKDTGSRMTVDQLIHHTSGLPPDYNSAQFSEGAAALQRYQPLEFARKFCQPELAAEPGAKWAYSNSGYLLLGLILEQVTGISFDELLRRQILDPLEMKNSGMDHNDLAKVGGATGYVRHAGPRYTPGPDLDRGRIFAAGAMYSTVEDLFRWDRALSSNELLSPKVREQMFKPGLENWACGWFVTRIPAGQPGAGQTRAEMRGDMPDNFFAWILRYPEKDAAIIVLRNAYGSTEHFEENLQAVLFGQPPQLPRPSPKDLFAHAFQAGYLSLIEHRLLLTGAASFVCLAIVCRAISRKTPRAAVT